MSKSSNFPPFTLHRTDESSVSLLRSDEFTTIREPLHDLLDENDNPPSDEEEEGDALEPKDYVPEMEEDNKFIDAIFEIAANSSDYGLGMPPDNGVRIDNRPSWVKTAMPYSGIRLWLICVCFWICSVGTFFLWFSFNGTIFYWTPIYGPEILLYMTTCYSLPGFFVQLLQARYDLQINQRFGKLAAFRFRMMLLCLVLIAITVSVPFLPINIYLFCALIVAVGTASSAGYGTLFQLVTLYPKKATSFLSLGYASPGLILLLLTRAIFGDDHEVTSLRFYLLFGIAGSATAIGLIAFLVLLRTSSDQLRDSKRANPSLAFEASKSIQDVEVQHTHKSIDNVVLIKKIWKSAMGIALLLVSRVTVFTILTHVPSEYGVNSVFSQRLVFINLGGDLLGRLLTILTPKLPEKQAPLIILCVALLQFTYLDFVLLYVYGKNIIPKNDIACQIVLGGFATMTGYFQTLSYAYGALQVDHSHRTQVGAILNLFTQIGNWFGLGLSFALRWMF